MFLYEVNMAKVRADAKCTWYNRVRVRDIMPVNDLTINSTSKIPSMVYKDITSSKEMQQEGNLRRDGREFFNID